MKIGEQITFFAELKSVNKNELGQRINFWLGRVKLSEWKTSVDLGQARDHSLSPRWLRRF